MSEVANVKEARVKEAGIKEAGIKEARVKGVKSAEDDAAQALSQLDRTMRYARSRLGADITIQRLLILLNVYLHEGLSQKELLAQLDATSVTALSRNLADLSAWTTKKQPGPGLIELRVDPMNLRRKTIHLTPKGRRLLRQVANAPGIKGA